jgi:hypothetical protein
MLHVPCAVSGPKRESRNDHSRGIFRVDKELVTDKSGRLDAFVNLFQAASYSRSSMLDLIGFDD